MCELSIYVYLMSLRAAVSTASFGVHDKPIKVLDGKSAKTHQKKSRT